MIDATDFGKPSHLLVLNKFPIIPNHFILATRENKAQTHLLEPDDLWVTYQCLKLWNAQDGADSEDGADAEDSLFAFFNSGDHSGATQPHRHVQLLPQKDMRHGGNGNDWTLLADELLNTCQASAGQSASEGVV